MNRSSCSFFALLIVFLALSGCYMKPVRHLAADVALLKVGETTQEDVIIFLGEPDEVQEAAGGAQNWLYVDRDKSLMAKTPLIGSKVGTTEFKRAVVTVKDGIVIDAVYSSTSDNEPDWAKDYSGQVKKK